MSQVLADARERMNFISQEMSSGDVLGSCEMEALIKLQKRTKAASVACEAREVEAEANRGE